MYQNRGTVSGISTRPSLSMRHGFTIVELLIVIIVIAILASITIVAYNGVQNRTNDTAVQSDLENIAKKIQVFYVTNERFPQGYTDMVAADIRVTKATYSRGMYNGTSWYNLVYCWANSTNPTQFAIVAQAKSGNVFQYVGGKVSQAAYVFATSSAATCLSAGVDISTSGRDWFYDNDTWQGFAK